MNCCERQKWLPFFGELGETLGHRHIVTGETRWIDGVKNQTRRMCKSSDDSRHCNESTSEIRDENVNKCEEMQNTDGRCQLSEADSKTNQVRQDENDSRDFRLHNKSTNIFRVHEDRTSTNRQCDMDTSGTRGSDGKRLTNQRGEESASEVQNVIGIETIANRPKSKLMAAIRRLVIRANMKQKNSTENNSKKHLISDNNVSELKRQKEDNLDKRQKNSHVGDSKVLENDIKQVDRYRKIARDCYEKVPNGRIMTKVTTEANEEREVTEATSNHERSLVETVKVECKMDDLCIGDIAEDFRERYEAYGYDQHDFPDTSSSGEETLDDSDEWLPGQQSRKTSTKVASGAKKRKTDRGKEYNGTGIIKKKRYRQDVECPTCGKSLGSKTDLNRHAVVHSGEKPFKCTICSKAFSQKGDLTRHSQNHENGKKFFCKFCAKGFNRKDVYNVHLRIHTKEKPFKCQHERCGKKFARKDLFEYHSRTHSGLKPYRCRLCDKYFAQRSLVRSHERTHQEKPFKCSDCKMSFRQRISLQRHVIKTHGQKMDENRGEGRN
ncbi:zinc finger protein 37 homolog [Nematostella vectensis]|nr:zinc finger protein 37 homolog [Nematostella vectensis]